MHIYKQLDDGKIIPKHYTPYAKPRIENGQEVLRPSTLSDFKKWFKKGERVAPSVTTILDIFAKHALTEWKINQHLDQAYYAYLGAINMPDHIPPIPHGEPDLYIKEIKRLTELQMNVAPSRGTDFHNDMERYTLGEIVINSEEDEKTLSVCQDVANLILEKTGKERRFWKPEINVYSDLGYAGQCDLFIPRDLDSHSWVIDYKTKQFAKQWKPKKMGYGDSHCAQLAAYGMELEPSGSFKAANIFVCLETGEIEWHEWSSEELIKWFEYFQLALDAWRIKNL
tara:strand:- start:465 stop:1313 length:849 start_codon:yes stop_codon:yes gene_type:complete